ncbi:MAG: hypothetical protein V4529_16935 [Gemmatimonadota bacterium]
MTPVEPTLHENAQLIVFAKDQPQYIPLPASVDKDGVVMTEWEPTADELDRLLSGARIRLWLHRAIGAETCPKCQSLVPRLLTPMNIEVGEPDGGMRNT